MAGHDIEIIVESPEVLEVTVTAPDQLVVEVPTETVVVTAVEAPEQLSVAVHEAPPLNVAVQEEVISVVEVVLQQGDRGERGIKGDKGDKGDAGEAPSFLYEQPSPSPLWTINHNLGFKPAVAVYNTGSQEIDAHVSHTSNIQTLVLFTTPVAGFARLN